ncbi:family 20 glycosylhydrolase [soil metagenome]
MGLHATILPTSRNFNIFTKLSSLIIHKQFKIMKKYVHRPVEFIISFLLLWNSVLMAQDVSIIPVPAQMQRGSGYFPLNSSTRVIVPSSQGDAYKVGLYLIDKIKPATGYNLKIEENGQAGIQLILNSKADARIGNEGYTLEVTPGNVFIKANAPAGLFYGVQTLLQLFPNEIESKEQQSIIWQIPVVSVVDYPRFSWRGIMLDVSRHFFTKEYVKEYIDQIARYKYNVFHWHLTDDNGWRIEIKSFPKLTEVGAWRVPRTGTFGSNTPPKSGEAATDGGFYTQEDIKEIIKYASDRYVKILPEIDVPGHSMAAIAAYPELSVTKDPNTKVNPGSNFAKWFGPGKFEMYIDNTLNPTDEKVYQFLDKVFAEVATLFPFEYIHMGGDECYKGYWEKDANVQAFMKKMNLKDGIELQSYFNKRMSKILKEKKKKLIGWDEILEGGIESEAAVMSWRGTKGGIEATHQKHTVVMSPSPTYYLDIRQGDLSIDPGHTGRITRLKEVYDFDMLPVGIDSTFVWGGQGNLWTEQIATESHAEYMTYPRAFAIAETLWSPKIQKNWDKFTGRVENHFDRFDQAGVNYSRSMFDPIIGVKKNEADLLEINMSTEVNGLVIYYTIDNSIPNQYNSKYIDPIVFPEDVDMLRVITYRNGKPTGRLLSIKTEDLEKRIKK